MHWVDAPVTGSKIGAENGQLIFIVGGAAEPVAYLDPLFKAMGKPVIRIGGTSKGQAAKLGMNLMIALIYEGFAEAFVLSRKLGVEPAKLIELIEASMVRSGVVDYKAPFVLRHDYSPNFPLRLMHKDIHLMLDMAKENPHQAACAGDRGRDLRAGDRRRHGEPGLRGDAWPAGEVGRH